jgi:UDP-N-acetyl-2-amino-2-deoxyglucuronate dehydrogenase
MAKSYKVAIAGCGSIAHAHVEGYQQLENVEIVAVVDPHAPARQIYMDTYGIAAGYETIESMLESVVPDIVSICTWHLLHPQGTIAAARGGVAGVICEKPMAIGAGAADSMIEACEASGTKLVVSHQRRFTPGWEKARELIAAGAIGQPIFAKNQVIEGLMNWGTHTIDGTRFVLGDPAPVWVFGAVERKTDRYERGVAIEDACMGLVHFDNGVQLLVESDLEHEGAAPGEFQIEGSAGWLNASETSLRLFTASTAGWSDIDLQLQEGDKDIGGNTNANQVRELIAWIEGGPQHRGAGTEARVTVEIMMALYESARRHAVVRFPLVERNYPLDLMIAEGKLPLKAPGKNDIRAFLKRDGIDEGEFTRLWSEGVPHHLIMRQLTGADDSTGG